jgi:hypothetical protein
MRSPGLILTGVRIKITRGSIAHILNYDNGIKELSGCNAVPYIIESLWCQRYTKELIEVKSEE